MDAFQQINTTTDALRLAYQDLDASIEAARGAHRRGKLITGKNHARHLRDCYELRIKAEALGAAGPLIDHKSDCWKPLPVHTQLVGRTSEQRKAIEWKGVFNAFPFWVYARRHGQTSPVQFLEAAE